MRVLGRSILLGALVGVAAGVASAVFLHLLDRATAFREGHAQVVYLLPLAGLAIGLIYERWGASIRRGNDLVIDTVHDAGPQLPLRMAPMVLAGTVLTHLFGGSAGREGTAVQMGAALADAIAHRSRATPKLRRRLLAAGIAGGFASVFGTPFAGTVFGLEVLALGSFEMSALAPAAIAAFVGDVVTRALGVAHTAYPRVEPLPLDLLVFAKLCVLGVAMAGAAIAFIELTHGAKARLARWLPRLPLRMLAGGLAVVVMWKLVRTDDYLGLGVPTIVRAFEDPTLAPYAFAAKIVFTAVTLAAGFVGGEVTPLFFVGATLGSVVARWLGLPIALGAGAGLAAVFGAAANAPFALTIMAVELLGAAALPHVFVVTAVAFLLTGHRGIYQSQRIHRGKYDVFDPALRHRGRLEDARKAGSHRGMKKNVVFTFRGTFGAPEIAALQARVEENLRALGLPPESGVQARLERDGRGVIEITNVDPAIDETVRSTVSAQLKAEHEAVITEETLPP